MAAFFVPRCRESVDNLHPERVALLDPFDEVESVHNLAEAGVVAVEVGRGSAVVNDEELAAAGIAPRVRHAQHAFVVELVVAVELAVDGVSGAAVADAVGAAALRHEAGDDAVEFEALVEAVFREFHEVGHGVRSVLLEEFHGQGAVVGDDFALHGPKLHRPRPTPHEKAPRNFGGLFK